jgi:hypothetical protein
VDQVNLYYSSDGFGTINNAGFYDWTTPGEATTTAQVRVESVLSPTTVYDVSGAFSLYATGSFTTYLPVALMNHASVSSCEYPLSDATIQPLTARIISTPTTVNEIYNTQAKDPLAVPSRDGSTDQSRRARRK